jgi:6,7-dimethyl-8-ribityllumazine synthase
LATGSGVVLSFDSTISFEKFRFIILKSRWYPEVIDALESGARNLLLEKGVPENGIESIFVPGTYELPLAAQFALESGNFDAAICLGCVVHGETPHFDFVCQAAAQGILIVGLRTSKPVIFGVLTTFTLEQAKERAGGLLGNKGIDAANAALEMLSIQQHYQIGKQQ